MPSSNWATRAFRGAFQKTFTSVFYSRVLPTRRRRSRRPAQQISLESLENRIALASDTLTTLEFAIPAEIANKGVYLVVLGASYSGPGVFLSGNTGSYTLATTLGSDNLTIANGGLIQLVAPLTQNPTLATLAIPSDYLNAGQAVIFVGGTNPGVASNVVTVNSSGDVSPPTVATNPNDVFQLFELSNISSGGISNPVATITSVSWATNKVTVKAANSMAQGQIVQVSGVSQAAYNGFFTITSASPTQFTYILSTNPGPGTGGTATVSGLDVDLTAIDQIGVTYAITSSSTALGSPAAPYPLSQTGTPVSITNLYSNFDTYFAAGSPYQESLTLGRSSSGEQLRLVAPQTILGVMQTQPGNPVPTSVGDSQSKLPAVSLLTANQSGTTVTVTFNLLPSPPFQVNDWVNVSGIVGTSAPALGAFQVTSCTTTSFTYTAASGTHNGTLGHANLMYWYQITAVNSAGDETIPSPAAGGLGYTPGQSVKLSYMPYLAGPLLRYRV